MSISERLEAGELVLTRVVPADVPAIVDAVRASWREIHPWMEWATADYDEDAGLDWATRSWRDWRIGKAYEFVIRPAEDPSTVLGTVGLNSRYLHRANLGFWVHSAHTGRGICTRAARRLARAGLEEEGLRRIYLRHLVDNIGSQRVAEKVGFRREGVVRNQILVRGEPRDMVQYSLISVDELRAEP